MNDLSPAEQELVPTPDSANAASLIVGNFAFNFKMPNESAISMQGMVYLDDEPEHVNRRMDMFRTCAKRQQEIAEIPLLQAQIDQIDMAIKQQEDMLGVSIAKRDRGNKLTSSDHQQLNNIPNALKQLRESRLKGEKRIAELNAKHGLV